MARLGRLVGRGRALEILLSGDDVDARRAFDYGYVNRLIDDAEIEEYADGFARRIARFDKVSLAETKRLVDVATLPEDDEFAPGLAAFFQTAGRASNMPVIQELFARGMQEPDGVELDLGSGIADVHRKVS